MTRTYRWSLITRSNTVIITEPRKYRLLARVEAWRKSKSNPGLTVSVEESPRFRRA